MGCHEAKKKTKQEICPGFQAFPSFTFGTTANGIPQLAYWTVNAALTLP